MATDDLVLCPLLQRKIDLPYCYEIGLVIDKLAKPSIIKDKIDLETAHTVCKKCKYYDWYNTFK